MELGSPETTKSSAEHARHIGLSIVGIRWGTKCIKSEVDEIEEGIGQDHEAG
jgi:hypothetical protein